MDMKTLEYEAMTEAKSRELFELLADNLRSKYGSSIKEMSNKEKVVWSTSDGDMVFISLLPAAKPGRATIGINYSKMSPPSLEGL